MGGAGDSEHHIKDLFKSRLLRRAPSAHSPTSQPFSACNCRRENLLVGEPSWNFLRFLCFLDVLFCSFFPPNFPFLFVICTNIYCSTSSTAQHCTAQSPLHKAQHSTGQHSAITALRTKQQTKYVPIKSTYPKKVCTYFIHACGAQVVFLEHGALGICRWPTCTQDVGPSKSSAMPFHSPL